MIIDRPTYTIIQRGALALDFLFINIKALCMKNHDMTWNP